MTKESILAAQKHFDDASALFLLGRFDNAAYLCGYVIECSLKSLLVHSAGPSAKALGHDIELQFKKALDYYSALSPSTRRIRLPIMINANHVIWTWRVEMRYDPVGSITRQQSEAFLETADKFVRQACVQQQLDFASLTQP